MWAIGVGSEPAYLGGSTQSVDGGEFLVPLGVSVLVSLVTLLSL